jgi:hypothetical protein
VFGGGLRKGGGSRTSPAFGGEEGAVCYDFEGEGMRGGRFLGRGRRRGAGRGRRRGVARRGFAKGEKAPHDDFGEARAVVPWWGAPRWNVRSGRRWDLGAWVVLPLIGGPSVRIIGPAERVKAY